MIYIASPFFNAKQLDFVAKIEDRLHKEDFVFFSPRKVGILLDMDEKERQNSKAEIYNSNISAIDGSSIIVAVIDDRDIGTIWEMGYAVAQGKRVISISNENYGLNIMLAESVQAHVNSIEDMVQALINPHYKGMLQTGLT
jgi:nucleoside 2-deoxyribosyltransferase